MHNHLNVNQELNNTPFVGEIWTGIYYALKNIKVYGSIHVQIVDPVEGKALISEQIII